MLGTQVQKQPDEIIAERICLDKTVIKTFKSFNNDTKGPQGQRYYTTLNEGSDPKVTNHVGFAASEQDAYELHRQVVAKHKATLAEVYQSCVQS